MSIPHWLRVICLSALIGVSALSWPAAAHEGHPKAANAAPAADPGGPYLQPQHSAGAPSSPEAQMAAEGHAMDEAPPKTFGGRLVNWLGKWHPSLVHFPIALFLVAGLLEARAVLLRKARLSEATRIMVGLGALSALAAIVLGWMAMGWTYGRYDRLHTAHQTLGTSIALLALGTWWAHETWLKGQGRAIGWLYALLLTGTVAAIAINGFMGGALVRGLDHLNF